MSVSSVLFNMNICLHFLKHFFCHYFLKHFNLLIKNFRWVSSRSQWIHCSEWIKPLETLPFVYDVSHGRRSILRQDVDVSFYFLFLRNFFFLGNKNGRPCKIKKMESFILRVTMDKEKRETMDKEKKKNYKLINNFKINFSNLYRKPNYSCWGDGNKF